MIAYCHPDGRIGFSHVMPPETLPILIGPYRTVENLIRFTADQTATAYAVPGMAKARSDEEAQDALRRYVETLNSWSSTIPANDGGPDAA
jgi:hypothetical protein